MMYNLKVGCLSIHQIYICKNVKHELCSKDIPLEFVFSELDWVYINLIYQTK